MAASGLSMGFLFSSVTTAQAFEGLTLTEADMPEIAKGVFSKFTTYPITSFDGTEAVRLRNLAQ